MPKIQKTTHEEVSNKDLAKLLDDYAGKLPNTDIPYKEGDFLKPTVGMYISHGIAENTPIRVIGVMEGSRIFNVAFLHNDGNFRTVFFNTDQVEGAFDFDAPEDAEATTEESPASEESPTTPVAPVASAAAPTVQGKG